MESTGFITRQSKMFIQMKKLLLIMKESLIPINTLIKLPRASEKTRNNWTFRSEG